MAGNSNSLDQSTFNKLRRLYIIALSAIALSVIISQILIHVYLNDQNDDSRVVNVAGRQRMLSQKLTKEILLLSSTDEPDDRRQLLENIKNTQSQWKISHEALQSGSDSLGLPGNNSTVIAEMFAQIKPYYENMLEASNRLIYIVETDPAFAKADIATQVENINANEDEFLQLMDSIVNQYDVEANNKVNRLRNLELLIMVVTLLLLLGEFLFIFWPTAKAVKGSMRELMEAEKTSKKMAINADLLSTAKEKSVRELRALSQAMNQTLLFARIDSNGFIVHMGDKFSRLFKFRRFNNTEKFSEVLSIRVKEQQVIDAIILENRKTGWQGEIKATTKDEESIWLDMSIVPFTASDERAELLIICLDITKRKEAQLEIERLNKANFEEKIHQQKVVSRQIIENQEKEQNRIAKDLHDGIGQMLTGLKFNIESIDLTDTKKAVSKIDNLKTLTSNIIKGVRTATFNLTPPELTDHGIVPALTKMTQELSKLTAKNIILFNKTDFNLRLDSLVEINIYRITQEAINNAVKYAESSHIIVSLSHSQELLSITIDDNGKGFDPTKVKRAIGEGGMGMTFMRERVKYINGRLFMHSSPNEGTRITLNVPI
ncbi:ATP-binding protein [Leeuwenhoekiella sp. A16]|uniref:sensor histidine kinase n=1 Tax=unclassified Leeuwenhoekiella TaxID=2615029 RepID=UPI003A8078B2